MNSSELKSAESKVTSFAAPKHILLSTPATVYVLTLICVARNSTHKFGLQSYSYPVLLFCLICCITSAKL